MLMQYFDEGIQYLLNSIPISLIIFCAITCIKWFAKKKVEIKPSIMLCEFSWILTVYTILEITGIIGMDFRLDEVLNRNIHCSFTLFQEGLSMMMLLNGLLFIPFGFFTAIIFKRIQKKWLWGFLIGMLFSGTIEFLQIFTGRYVQVDDLLMNTIGSFFGYGMCFLLLKLKAKHKPQKYVTQE